MDQDRFAATIYDLAKIVAGKHAVNAAIMAAQAVLESGFGRSLLSKKANNLFGIKASARWKGPRYPIRTREWSEEQGFYVIVAEFRVYADWSACMEDYAKIIETLSWYRDAAGNCTDPVKYLDGILPRPREPGWATDPHYRDKILSICRRFKWIE
jgi:flagellum-specific peptidoglycan hydrolase FlgJ